MPIQRRRVLYSGRVQGVGFRATARRIAGGFAVAGHVRNLDDGRVELVAEGEPGAIQGFLDAVDEALGRNIQGSSVRDETPTDPPLAGFTIRS